MEDIQIEKLGLRVSQLLRERNGLVQVVIVSREDGSLQIQVVGGQSETIPKTRRKAT